MNIREIKWSILKPFSPSLMALLAGFSLVLGSCAGQDRSGSKSYQEEAPPTLSVGELVEEITGEINLVFQGVGGEYWFVAGDQGVYQFTDDDLIFFSTKDGLLSSSIIGIQQDHLGNIYFDSFEGVCKFDGENFETLEVLEYDSSQQNWKLGADDLWFRMGWDQNGPYRFDGENLYQLEFPKTERAEAFYAQFPHRPYNPYGLYSTYRDRAGSMWFGTASLGICRFDGTSLSWMYEDMLTKTPSGGDFGIRSMVQDSEGHFWFCNGTYRYKMLPEDSTSTPSDTIAYKRLPGFSESDLSEISNTYFMSLLEDKNGDLWMAAGEDGVLQMKDGELTSHIIPTENTPVAAFSLYEDKDGGIWLTTTNYGLYKFNGSSFEKFTLKLQG